MTSGKMCFKFFIQVGNNLVPAHKYILACKSEYFRKILTEKEEALMPGKRQKIPIENVNYEVFLQMLKYIYTDTCDVLTIGATFSVHSQEQHPIEMEIDIPEPSYQVSNGKKQSALEVYQSRKVKSGKGIKKEAQKTTSTNRSDGLRSKNPVTLLQQMASRFGVRNLSKRYINLTILSDTK